MLIIIQNMAARLGIATGKSLAINIRNNFSRPVSAFSRDYNRPCLCGYRCCGASGRSYRFQSPLRLPSLAGGLVDSLSRGVFAGKSALSSDRGSDNGIFGDYCSMLFGGDFAGKA